MEFKTLDSDLVFFTSFRRLCCPQNSGWLLTYGEAVDEWIARMLRGTPANGIVISHDTQCVLGACIFAGITASRIHACFALLAVGANETLGSAARRDTEVTGEARTGGLIAEFAAYAVGSAGGGLAGLNACYRDAT